jgi:hypothetical protein
MKPMNPGLVQRIKNQKDRLHEILLYIHLDSNLDSWEVQEIESSKELLEELYELLK